MTNKEDMEFMQSDFIPYSNCQNLPDSFVKEVLDAGNKT